MRSSKFCVKIEILAKKQFCEKLAFGKKIIFYSKILLKTNIGQNSKFTSSLFVKISTFSLIYLLKIFFTKDGQNMFQNGQKIVQKLLKK